MNHSVPTLDYTLVEVRNADVASPLVVICEHASPFIPPEFDHLGLAASDRESHVVWDPGANALATRLASRLDATLINSKISRLVYDCNRPPDAHDAIPARSETVDVPGNADLTAEERADRVERFYRPFRETVASVLNRKTDPILVTVHSFTPIYYGERREVEVGVLHDNDARLADVLLSDFAGLASMIVRRNEPYGPADGVTHTLKEHALPGGHLNVMLEVRNDLLADEVAQSAMAVMLSDWLAQALAKVEARACKV
ncbi:MAG: N-formylglutamate amidohydrolase [Paracoccaceae bacterium]|nr:N-formylglutamate amidohydrolase [Paracoccaceae bacterium]